MLLKREQYLKFIRPYYDVDLIKVITGVRRAGKSVLLTTIMQELRDKGIEQSHILYMNLEDLDYGFIKTAMDLHKYVKKLISDTGRYYLFVDEIQHISDFEKALASFRATMNVSIFVTGSNSTLLNGEMATLLTGRTVEFEVLPFSFAEIREYLDLNKKHFDDGLIYDYIKWGGFPLRFDLHQEADVHKYIDTLYNAIIDRDIVVFKGALNRNAFGKVAKYILANTGQELSLEKVARSMAARENGVTSRTIYNYVDKMCKAYLLHPVQRYDIPRKKGLKSRPKYYATDMAFATINTNTLNIADGFYLENVVYNELKAQGFLIYVGKTYKGEVDFVAIKNGKKCFIQVAYLLNNEDVLEREFGAYGPITDSSPKYVLSLDKMDFSRDGIIHLNIVDFLLHRVNLMLS